MIYVSKMITLAKNSENKLEEARVDAGESGEGYCSDPREKSSCSRLMVLGMKGLEMYFEVMILQD